MDIVRSMAKRAKKFIWLICIVPLVLGAAGWLVPVGKMPAGYQSSATLSVGNYGDPLFDDSERVVTYLTNAPFYQKELPELWSSQGENLFRQLDVSPLKGDLIQLTYTGTSEADAVQTVNRIADAFLREDNGRYKERTNVIDQSLRTLENMKSKSQNTVDRQRMLYKLRSDKLKLHPAEVVERADATSGGGAFTPKKRAVLGVLIGLTLVFAIIALPEFVRDDRRRQNEPERT
ncbi:MAG: hydrolase [Sporolactobacillus sp.]|jgi:teichuronic acid biosynthesis protein TuaF|nr:hydrolase [Sporolactobacillus sp.]MCI1881573.1 hydrolase [Sporolactobacillus sp.]